MVSYNSLLTILFFLVASVLILSNPSQAQNTDDDFLQAHNEARDQVGVEPMTWDSTLADYAYNYAIGMSRDCRLQHSGGPYGENLAMGGGEFSARDAVAMWVNERQYYDYSSNSCADGRVCGHYTQVVWSSSVRLGCARVMCDNGNWFIICSYDPPGNIEGERPY